MYRSAMNDLIKGFKNLRDLNLRPCVYKDRSNLNSDRLLRS